jgi:hypothetical protein
MFPYHCLLPPISFFPSSIIFYSIPPPFIPSFSALPLPYLIVLLPFVVFFLLFLICSPFFFHLPLPASLIFLLLFTFCFHSLRLSLSTCAFFFSILFIPFPSPSYFSYFPPPPRSSSYVLSNTIVGSKYDKDTWTSRIQRKPKSLKNVYVVRLLSVFHLYRTTKIFPL